MHFIIRPNQQVFETPAGLTGKFDRAKPVRLRATLDQGTVNLEAAQGSDAFQNIATLPFPKPPVKLRVGKVGRGGKGGDYEGADINAEPHPLPPVGARRSRRRTRSTPTPRTDLPRVAVHYELYDGIPLFSKWIIVTHTGDKPVRLNTFTSHELKLAEVESSVNTAPTTEKFNLWVETDMAFGDMMPEYANPCVKFRHQIRNIPTQVHYERQTPCLLRCAPPLGPGSGDFQGQALRIVPRLRTCC